MLFNCLAVGFGGFVGAVLRYLAGMTVPAADFPWSTLAVNIVGSFALGLIAALVVSGVVADERLSLFLRVGLCGGFTTFSTFSLEAMQMAQAGHGFLVAAYCVGMVALCVAAAFAGDWVGRLAH